MSERGNIHIKGAWRPSVWRSLFVGCPPHNRLYVTYRPVYRFGDSLFAVRKLANMKLVDPAVWHIMTEDDWLRSLVYEDTHRLEVAAMRGGSSHRLVGVVGPLGFWWSPGGSPEPSWAKYIRDPSQELV